MVFLVYRNIGELSSACVALMKVPNFVEKFTKDASNLSDDMFTRGEDSYDMLMVSYRNKIYRIMRTDFERLRRHASGGFDTLAYVKNREADTMNGPWTTTTCAVLQAEFAALLD